MLARLVLSVAVFCIAAKAEESKRLLKDTLHLDFCPIVDCAFPAFCQDLITHISSIHIGGRICPGCPTCTVTDLLQGQIAKRVMSLPLSMRPLCPEFMCMDMACLDGGIMQTHYVTINGHLCPTCPICHSTLDVAKRSTQPVLDFFFLNCPIFECAYPGPCPEGYVYTHILRNGHNCTGCPTCPSGNHLLLNKLQA